MCVSWTNTPTPTHVHTPRPSPTWCPIFLLAHQLLCLHTDACSVRRVCHQITMQPFSEQTLPATTTTTPRSSHPPTPSEGKHNCSCSLLRQPWQNIFNKTSPHGDSLCAVQSTREWFFLHLRHTHTHTKKKKTSAILRQYWLALCVCVSVCVCVCVCEGK